jgi:hypothetical protein
MAASSAATQAKLVRTGARPRLQSGRRRGRLACRSAQRAAHAAPRTRLPFATRGARAARLRADTRDVRVGGAARRARGARRPRQTTSALQLRSSGCAPRAVLCAAQVLLGDMGAGKSSLVLRFVKGQFFDFQARSRGRDRGCRGWRVTAPRIPEPPQESTIGAAFLTQTVSVNEATVKFEIWCASGSHTAGARRRGCNHTRRFDACVRALQGHRRAGALP